ncbi:hypothetical protein [Burkholderia guangdongensis]|uniref:hypothetical protein n=1 Tax=Burkholderia guangdongensis TaxID=1792500 RepID=UPI0015CA16EF|nr:hypothetical protein [Burkholderia guangdongensis]
MNKILIGAVLGFAALAGSTAASAHVDVAIGLGVPGVYAPAPEPVYVAPPVAYAPVGYAPVGYRDDGWREREWREQEWRRREWREHQWREREHGWHDGERGGY